MAKCYHIFILVLTSLLHLSGQDNLAFGEWESHLPYQRGLSITQSPSKVYFGTEWSVMSIDKEDFSLEFISKVNGLSSIGVSDIKYDASSGFLMVVYADSDIDVLTPAGTVNVADIKNNLGIVGDKTINDIHFENQTAYLATGFGVVSYDMENLEFGFTTQMGLQVYSTTLDQDGNLYAATEDGIYSLDLNQDFNFGDFANWTFLGPEVGLPLVYDCSDIEYDGSNLFMISDNQVWVQKDNTFEIFQEAEAGEEFTFLSEDGPEFMIGSRFEGQFNSRITYVDSELNISLGTQSCSNFVNNAIGEESGRIWYADEWNGFRYTDSKDGDCRTVSVNSPFSHTVSDLAVKDGVLYCASGGVTDGFNFQFNRNGLYVLDEGEWTNYREGSPEIFRTEELLNVFKVAPHPDNDRVYLGSFFAGLMEANFQANTYSIFNSDNSQIVGSTGEPGREKVAGLAFDNNKTLWITLYEAQKPLVAITAEGTIHSFDVVSSTRLADVAVDDLGYKWIQVFGGGVLVYDDNGTPNNPSDDRQKIINSSNSNLKTNFVNAISKDLDGDMWVGTTQGPVIFGCGSSVFETDSEGNAACPGVIRQVTEDEIPAELLVTEDVRSIAVDGGNQKWIGTRNGIFVQSPGGTDKIARFTSENSPLFDDNIIDMAFDEESGIMYIASDRGVQAYKTSTTGGGNFHRTNVYAYPNPVRPEYEGLIAFKGFPRDATIKVTDIQGQLVHEGTALGGQATWDGLDYNGKAVASGVYLVFSNSRDNSLDPSTAVTKVLIVR